MAKALFYCNKAAYMKFLVIRVINKLVEIMKTYMIFMIYEDLTSHKDGYTYD